MNYFFYFPSHFLRNVRLLLHFKIINKFSIFSALVFFCNPLYTWYHAAAAVLYILNKFPSEEKFP